MSYYFPFYVPYLIKYFKYIFLYIFIYIICSFIKCITFVAALNIEQLKKTVRF